MFPSFIMRIFSLAVREQHVSQFLNIHHVETCNLKVTPIVDLF